MFPATTKGGGMALAFPDVCKVPAPPGPPVPVPFPNMAQCMDADGSTCTTKVKIMNKAVLHKGSEIPQTHGDEPGTLGGVVSGTFGDQAAYKTWSSRVKVEGSEIVAHLKTTGHNGMNANAPQGVQLVPSQVRVLVE